MTQEKPAFSFIIPVLNAERHIRTCLESIRAQDYPEDLVEIVVLDGGCTDGTIAVAREYGSRVYPNPGVLAEYGLQAGVARATGDMVVIFAADNELSWPGWLRTAAGVLTGDRDCAAVWGPLRSGADDPPVNRYFELIQSDPMTFFMNRNLAGYLRKGARLAGGGTMFRVDPKRPLPWGANGLVMRRVLVKEIWAQEGYLGDNDAFQQMVENGHDHVAYLPELVTYHHHVGEVRDFLSKWKRNFTKHFLDKLETRNTNWVFSGGFRGRLLLWLLYSANPVVSGLHAVYLGLRDRNRYWAYHPLLCLMQTSVYAYIMVATPKGREALVKVARGAV